MTNPIDPCPMCGRPPAVEAAGRRGERECLSGRDEPFDEHSAPSRRVVLVCGGRDYHEERTLFRALDMLRPTHIIAGGAKGADTLAEKWAKIKGIPCRVFKADWSKHRNAAGPIRNQQMLDEGQPDLVLAFPGGNGTADMVRRAWATGVAVVDLALITQPSTERGKATQSPSRRAEEGGG